MTATQTSSNAQLIKGDHQVGTANPQIFTPKYCIVDPGFLFGGTGWMMRHSMRSFRWGGHS